MLPILSRAKLPKHHIDLLIRASALFRVASRQMIENNFFRHLFVCSRLLLRLREGCDPHDPKVDYEQEHEQDAHTSLCGSRFESSALGPDVVEDECGDEESEKDSNSARKKRRHQA